MRRRSIVLKPVERDISKLIKDQLEIYYHQGKLRYFRAHPIRLVTSNGKTFPVKVEESQRGAPDLFVFLPTECWWIETKRPGAKLGEDQIRWREWSQFRFTPYRYFKVDTVTRAYEVLDLLNVQIG